MKNINIARLDTKAKSPRLWIEPTTLRPTTWITPLCHKSQLLDHSLSRSIYCKLSYADIKRETMNQYKSRHATYPLNDK